MCLCGLINSLSLCTCLLAFDFAHTLKVVIEELISGESGIVADMSNAQTKPNCHEGERDMHPHETRTVVHDRATIINETRNR